MAFGELKIRQNQTTSGFRLCLQSDERSIRDSDQ